MDASKVMPSSYSRQSLVILATGEAAVPDTSRLRSRLLMDRLYAMDRFACVFPHVVTLVLLLPTHSAYNGVL